VTSLPTPIATAHAESTEAIRRLTGEIFARLGWADGSEPREALLICGEIYCGRRFDVDGGCAVWLIDEDRLKFFGADGSVAQTIESASQIRTPRRMAA
jgi:hypothetical protein